MDYKVILPENKEDICRFCLNTDETMKQVLFSDEDPFGLAEKLSMVNLKINYDGSLPNKICDACIERIDSFLVFVSMIETNETILKCAYKDVKDEIIKQHAELKIEITEKYLCDSCGNSFECYSSLKKHENDCVMKPHPECKDVRTRHNEKFMCENCGHCFGRKHYLKKHLITCGRNEMHVCRMCGRKFKRQFSLNNHKCLPPKEKRKSINNDEEMYTLEIGTTCELCSITFKSELLFCLHFIHHIMYYNSEKIDAFLFCNICGIIPKTNEDLDKHIYEKHINDSADPYNCSKCGEKCDNDHQLIQHVHQNKTCICKNVFLESLTCSICKTTFENMENLNLHLLTHLQRQFHCLYCDEMFITVLAYSSHLKMYHPRYKHECGYCKKVFQSKGSLKSHISKTHENPGLRYICDVCLKDFSSKLTLSVHKKAVHQTKSIICAQCGYSTNSLADLKKHDRVHTNEKPYKCIFDGCDKAYKTNSHLNDHIKGHLDIRKFKCDSCPNAFKTSHTLKRHLLIHTGERKFKCNICESSFKRKHHYKRHLESHGKISS